MNKSSLSREGCVPSAINISDISGWRWTIVTKLVKCGDCYVSSVMGELVDFSTPPFDFDELQIISIGPTKCILIGDSNANKWNHR